MVSPCAFTFRLRGCPAAVHEAGLRERLSQIWGDVTAENIRIHSLALDTWGTATKTATLTFTKVPSSIQTQIRKEEWLVEGDDGLILDTHFLGLTPLNDVEAPEFDCIAISGLASHPFGSWQPKGDDRSWMWIRDALPKALPNVRAVLFGYDTTLVNSNSFQTIADLASSVLEKLKASDFGKRPLIFLTHSLGGIVFKEAVVALAKGDDRERQMLRQILGAVMFGVPSCGMETQALMAMVHGRVNEGLVQSLTAQSPHLQSLDELFHVIAHDKRMKLVWAYETKTSPTVAKQADGTFARTGLEVVLVTPESATRGLYGSDSTAIFAINENHSDIVKFRKGDPNCQVVFSKLRDICATQDSDMPKPRKLDPLSDQERHCMVPLGRNRDFVGRETILTQLLARIPPSVDKDDCQRTAIEGLGGIGKTQIALEATYQVRNKHPDCSVFWVPAVNATSFENAYRDIGRQLRIEGIDEDKADVKALVKAALSRASAGSWLLVVDNADDAELCGTVLQYLPFSHTGSILFTTRNHEVAVGLDIPERNIVTVPQMDCAEATKLLQTYLKESQVQATSIAALLDFLAYLPLAIKQAAAYMAKTGISTTKYFSYCQSSSETSIKLLSKDFEDRGRYQTIKNPITTTWLISFGQITRDNPLAADYLKFMCFLAEKDIPRTLLPPKDELEVDDAIGILKAYAFITEHEGQDSYSIHRLVRLATQNWIRGQRELEEQVSTVLRRLEEIFPFPQHENRDMWLRYLPHTLKALEFQENFIDEERKGHLLSNIGVSYSILGKFQEAEQIFRKRLKLNEKVLGREHSSTLASMNNLANVLNELGRYKEAEQMHRQAFQLKKKVLGPEHPSTLGSMNSLAVALKNLARYQEAEQMHRQGFKLREKVLGREHPDTLASMNNLATMLNWRGRYEEAEQMYRRTLKRLEKTLGNEHPHTRKCERNLARCLGARDKQARAK